MADLTITPSAVSPVLVWKQLTLPAGEVIDAGEVVYIDPTTAKFLLADASVAGTARAIGIAVNSGIVGQTITVVVSGLVDLGNALTAEAIDEILELSDTAGKIDDNLGGTVQKAVGRVVPAFGATAFDKLLAVDFNFHTV
jgi:hypothetical protein